MPHGPEADARDRIDGMREAAVWAVQHRSEYDPGVPEAGTAVEYPFETGPADYLLAFERYLLDATGTAIWYHVGIPVGPLRWVLAKIRAVRRSRRAFSTRTSRPIPSTFSSGSFGGGPSK